jgi:hypothetical protein
MIADNFEDIAKQLERIRAEETLLDQQAANEPDEPFDADTIRKMIEDELIEFMLYGLVIDSIV